MQKGKKLIVFCEWLITLWNVESFLVIWASG
jgi:hypothetical protein